MEVYKITLRAYSKHYDFADYSFYTIGEKRSEELCYEIRNKVKGLVNEYKSILSNSKNPVEDFGSLKPSYNELLLSKRVDEKTLERLVFMSARVTQREAYLEELKNIYGLIDRQLVSFLLVYVFCDYDERFLAFSEKVTFID